MKDITVADSFYDNGLRLVERVDPQRPHRARVGRYDCAFFQGEDG